MLNFCSPSGKRSFIFLGITEFYKNLVLVELKLGNLTIDDEIWLLFCITKLELDVSFFLSFLS